MCQILHMCLMTGPPPPPDLDPRIIDFFLIEIPLKSSKQYVPYQVFYDLI